MPVPDRASYANPTFATLAHVVRSLYRLLQPRERTRLRLTAAVVIAGALVNAGAPILLILDEATNALDLASEREVWKFIRAWLPDSIVLVAAHRVENFAGVDREVRIRDGRVESFA